MLNLITHDHAIRDELGFYRALAYLLANPTRAGLAAAPEAYALSSANARWAAHVDTLD